ncbi:FAD-NAD(P)-binding-domain-containing protein [Daldinia sp. FL1419]|nr:FAD-NAD(P)-binding-domain-containing protein [Daldinia sp. FL1419]
MEEKRQSRLARIADRRKYWDLGGRYGHPVYPRSDPYPPMEEMYPLTATQRRLRKLTEQAQRDEKVSYRQPHGGRPGGMGRQNRGGRGGRGDRGRGRGRGRGGGGGGGDRPVDSSSRDSSLSLNPPHQPEPSGFSGKISQRDLPESTRRNIYSLPVEVLLAIIEPLDNAARIRLAIAIPRLFQSRDVINIFALDAERQMRHLRVRRPPSLVTFRIEQPSDYPILHEAISRPGYGAYVVNRIIDGYSTVADDPLNNIWIFRILYPPLISAIYAIRPDLFRVLLERGASPDLRHPIMRSLTSYTLTHTPPSDCLIRGVCHRECQPRDAYSRYIRFEPCPDLLAHALYVYGSHRRQGIEPDGSGSIQRDSIGWRQRLESIEEILSIISYNMGLHRINPMGPAALDRGFNLLIEGNALRTVRDLVDDMARQYREDNSTLIITLGAIITTISLDAIDDTGFTGSGIEMYARLEDFDRRDDLLRHLIALGGRLDPESAVRIARRSPRVILLILRAYAHDTDEQRTILRYLANGQYNETNLVILLQLADFMDGANLARLLFAVIRDNDARLLEEFIKYPGMEASTQALLLAIQRNNIDLLHRLLRLPYRPGGDWYPADHDPGDLMDSIVGQGRSVLEGALVLRNFHAARLLIDNGFPTTIDEEVMTRVNQGLEELRGTRDPMTDDKLEAAGEPPLDSRPIRPVVDEDSGNWDEYGEACDVFRAVAKRLTGISHPLIHSLTINDPLDGPNLQIAIVGAGPRGASVLERACASAEEILQLTKGVNAGVRLIIHIIDPFPPGAGKVWRTNQTRGLITDTIASQMTLYTDSSVACSGPIRAGQTLHSWAESRGLKLGRNEYPTRAMHGEYLKYFFNQTRNYLPAGVSVIVHPDRAVHLDDGPEGLQILTLSNGDQLTGLSAVVLAQGHQQLTPSLQEQRQLEYARERGMSYILPANPIDADLSSITSGQEILLIGLGLNFFDYVALLTEGRGGRFERTASGYRYIKSGREPKIHASSDIGIPYLAKGDNKRSSSSGHTPYLLTDQLVAAFRKNAEDGKPPNFQDDIWPIVLKEVETVYYNAYMKKEHHPGRRQFRDRFLDTLPGSDEETQLLDEFNIPIEHRWNWSLMTRPHGGRKFETEDDWKSWLLDYLRADVLEARIGNVESPWKAATAALHDLCSVVRRIVSHNGIAPDSRGLPFDTFFQRDVAFLTGGPARICVEKLIALMEADVVTILGPVLNVRQDEQGGRNWIAESSLVGGSRKSVTGIIEARIPRMDIKTTTDELLRDLFQSGHCRAFTIGEIETGLDVTPRPYNIINNDGNVHPRRFAVGVLTEGAVWATARLPKPGQNSYELCDTDAVARGALKVASRTSPNPGRET